MKDISNFDASATAQRLSMVALLRSGPERL